MKKRSKQWDLVIPERKSKRHPQDGMTMLEKAQALKEQNNLEIPKGKKSIPSFSNDNLVDIASKIGIDLGSKEDDCSTKA